MGNGERIQCPVQATLRVIGGKWKVLILWNLHEEMRRFSELRRAIPGITQKMLTQQLRELESDGLVHREVYAEVPPRVEYSITDYGRSLGPLLATMCEWGTTHIDRINDTVLAREESRAAAATVD